MAAKIMINTIDCFFLLKGDFKRRAEKFLDLAGSLFFCSTIESLHSVLRPIDQAIWDIN